MARHHTLGAIGALVGVATAGVIVLMVMKDDPDETERREPVRPAVAVPEIPKTLPTPKKPSKVTAKADDAKSDPALARQQAIEQARNAGILGKAALTQGGAFKSLTGNKPPIRNFDDDKNIYGGLLGSEAGEMNGGFGFGPRGMGQGGGTGWGTIGTGRYGTITGGGGTGYGRMGGSGSKITLGSQTVTPATPAVADPGSLDKAIVRRYLRRNLGRIEACQEKAPKAAGSLAVKFVVVDTGRVTGVTATGVDANIASCVASVIGSIEMPKPRGTGGVEVTTTFTFKP